MLILLPLALVAAQPAPSEPHFFDRCDAAEDLTRLPCQAYLMGLAEGYAAGRVSGQEFARDLFCAPPTITPAETRRAVLDYVRRHPSARSLPPSTAYVVAMRLAYPCPEPPRR